MLFARQHDDGGRAVFFEGISYNDIMSLIIFLSFFLLPHPVFAHVQWFVTERDVGHTTALHFSLQEPFVILGILFALAVVTLIFVFERFIPQVWQISSTRQAAWRPFLLSLFSVLVGVTLIATSFQNHILDPSAAVTTILDRVMQVLQTVAGVLLLLRRGQKIAASILLLLIVFFVTRHGSIALFEHAELISIALFFFLFQPAVSTSFSKALTALRWGAGIALVTLGLTEKLLAPERSVLFLQKYPWNVLEIMHINSSDLLFIFIVGLAEVVLGLLLGLGKLTQWVVLCILLLMGFTAILLGPLEIIGHLPFFAIAILLFGNRARVSFAS